MQRLQHTETDGRIMLLIHILPACASLWDQAVMQRSVQLKASDKGFPPTFTTLGRNKCMVTELQQTIYCVFFLQAVCSH